jgi:MFS transporter, MHS family, proline/betaine transporter
MPTYANKFLNTPLDDAFLIQCIAILLMTIITPLSGALSDRIGRRWLMQLSLLAYVLMLIPAFSWFIAAATTARLAIMQIALCGTLGIFLGPFSASVAELFPSKIRSTGMAISYNTSVMLFGGFAPMIVTWLLSLTGSKLTPAYYLMFGAVLGIVGCFLIKRRAPLSRVDALLSTTDR